jgi:hypothetical protein
MDFVFFFPFVRGMASPEAGLRPCLRPEHLAWLVVLAGLQPTAPMRRVSASPATTCSFLLPHAPLLRLATRAASCPASRCPGAAARPGRGARSERRDGVEPDAGAAAAKGCPATATRLWYVISAALIPPPRATPCGRGPMFCGGRSVPPLPLARELQPCLALQRSAVMSEGCPWRGSQRSERKVTGLWVSCPTGSRGSSSA